jgi:D-alanyl-lipoteichoic acid acyltransferase DltB (MBOAT superfamily)
MLFNTVPFIAGFLPAALGGFLLAGRFGYPTLARMWILLASLFFYAWWSSGFLLLLVCSVTANFVMGRQIQRGAHKRFWLIAGLSFNLGSLAFFKYANFFAGALGEEFPGQKIPLPLGISFYTFQQIMFIVDTYVQAAPAVSLLDYFCFVSFFPHVIAGPLVRPKAIIPQFANLKGGPGTLRQVSEGLEIFLLGLAKKLVMADSLAQFANPGFAAAAHHDPLTLIEAWVSLSAYGLQIYFDFSGYSDMAIGLARMFGIHFPVNFHSPYKARDISEFWKRWNITLSGFLRDYLYIPLGGSRRGEGRRIFNVLVTMLLGGLWHGAALRFVLWGGLHGCFLIVHGWFERTCIRLPKLLCHGLTLSAVLLAWVPFRSTSFSACIEFYKGLFGVNGFAIPDIFLRQAPWLRHLAHSVPVLPYLGSARTLSLPQGILLLIIAWTGVLALPDIHNLTSSGRALALVSSFCFTLQAILFAPSTLPFLYFQF